MSVAILIARLLARSFQLLGNIFIRLSDGLYNLLPVFCPAPKLSAMVRAHYVQFYESYRPDVVFPDDYVLDTREREMLDRYAIRSGRILVMGAGRGREAFAIARRGLEVVGVDADDLAIRDSARLAKGVGLRVAFHQADILALPYTARSFDYALLADLMYSSIPGVQARQRWLTDVLDLLKPHGFAIINFSVDREPQTFARRVGRHVAVTLSRLPGANSTYQAGDSCYSGHFLHVFRDAAEVHAELASAGGLVKELMWPAGYAIVAARHHQ